MKNKDKIKNVIKSKSFILLIICLGLTTLLITETIFFKKEIEKINNNPYQLTLSPSDNFVFLGDSITAGYPLNELFEDVPVVNSGVSGYTTEDILNNIDEMVTIYNPTKVFILIGTNDIQREKTNEEIITNIEEIVKEILEKRPKTKIYIESIYPINNTEDEKINLASVGIRNNDDIKLINKELKKYCQDNNYTYIDMYQELVDDSDNLSLQYTTEGLHISNLGYLKITKVLYEYLNN